MAQTQTAVEYYYANWNFYFVTSSPDEISVLDGGAFGGVWKRTGQTFTVWSDASGGRSQHAASSAPVLRRRARTFTRLMPPNARRSRTTRIGDFQSIAFYLRVPDANGNCPAGTVILYRLYNNGMGGAANHRFTTDAATFAQMQAAGWLFEGDGKTGAFACVCCNSPCRRHRRRSVERHDQCRPDGPRHRSR